jgi:hypothetical protein
MHARMWAAGTGRDLRHTQPHKGRPPLLLIATAYQETGVAYVVVARIFRYRCRNTATAAAKRLPSLPSYTAGPLQSRSGNEL